VLQEVLRQVRAGEKGIMGFMLESNLVEGRQDEPVVFGQSITDSCISIAETRALLVG
jgi:3-deoxy-7-phosphoheptulonate synthase